VTAEPRPVVAAFRAVAGSILVVRLFLLGRNLQTAALQVAAPVDDSFFPELLKHPALLIAATLVPIGTGLLSVLRPTRTSMRLHAGSETLSATTLLLHQATYFFATWTIVFWGDVFLVWLTWSGGRTDTHARETGPFLAQLMIAFIFLGGAAGKWTAGYWSGEPFNDIFFVDNSSLLFSLLRSGFDEPTLPIVARWYSRMVVLMESAMVLVIFMPARVAAILGVVAALGMWSASASLFEVALPIMGMAGAAWILGSRPVSGPGHPASR
jgi:hypothetical protein